VMDFFERPGREGEEIGADGLGLGESRTLDSGALRAAGAGELGVRYHGPVSGCVDRQGKFALQVRLIETRERHAGVHWDKKRVDIFAAVVFIFEASDGLAGRRYRGSEVNLDYVFADAQQLGRKLDVALLNCRWRSLTVDNKAAHRAFAKI